MVKVWLIRILLLLFSCSVVSDSLWPHGLQHSRLPCPSLSPGVCSKSCIGRIFSHLKFLNAVIWADQKYFLYQPFTRFKVPLSAFPEMPSGGGHFFLELILFFERRDKTLLASTLSPLAGWVNTHIYPAVDLVESTRLVLVRVKERTLSFLSVEFEHIQGFNEHLSYLLSGCFEVQDIFVKTFTSPFGLGWVQIGTSADSLILYLLCLPVFIKILANVDHNLIS